MDSSSPAITKDVLVAENIFLSIGEKDILNGATIRSEVGHITGLLGRNGAGKSTMLKAIQGTGKADECDVFVNGRKINSAYCINSLLNYLPQKPFLLPGIRVKSMLSHFGVSFRDIAVYFPELEDDLDKKISELSGGTERLWSVLTLLFAPTRFTLLDEPFSHIMPLHLEGLLAVMQSQKVRKGIIITDHLYKTLLDTADSLYLMKDGKSIFIKNRSDLVLHGYMGSM